MNLERFIFPVCATLGGAFCLVSLSLVSYRNGEDAGYYRRALEQQEALKEQQDRCDIKVEASVSGTHQRDENYCDERVFEIQSLLNACQDGNHKAGACQLPNPSSTKGK